MRKSMQLSTNVNTTIIQTAHSSSGVRSPKNGKMSISTLFNDECKNIIERNN